MVDMLTPVFGFGTAPFVELREQVWLDVLTRAAGERMDGVIITFTPERTVSTGFMADLTESMEASGAETIFVQLTCPDEVLERRMENDSRAQYGKIHSLVQYRRIRDSGGFDYPPIPDTRLVIDTSTLDPQRAAQLIIERFSLPVSP